MLALSLSSVPLNDIVVVVSALEGRLHTGKLMLYSVELDTCLLSGLSDLSDGFFTFAKFEIHTLVLVRQLLCQRVLEARHQRL